MLLLVILPLVVAFPDTLKVPLLVIAASLVPARLTVPVFVSALSAKLELMFNVPALLAVPLPAKLASILVVLPLPLLKDVFIPVMALATVKVLALATVIVGMLLIATPLLKLVPVVTLPMFKIAPPLPVRVLPVMVGDAPLIFIMPLSV